MNLETVVPWGRDLLEYRQMFNLEDENHILGVADGPASFAKEMRALGKDVVSVDVVYQFKASDIEKRMLDVAPIIEEQIRKNVSDFKFGGRFKTVKDVVDSRLKTMRSFLEDYEDHPEFYQYGSVTDLPFEDNSFELSLVSHFLFLYSKQLDLDFHTKAIKELLRVSSEVRIFPLTDLEGHTSCHLEKIRDFFKQHDIEIVQCSYDFVRAADSYLRIRKRL